MKTSIITFSLLLSSLSAVHATNIGDEDLSLIKHEKLTLSLENVDQKTLFVSSNYNESENCIAIEFESELVMIQLINHEGELEMMFPVSSNKVNLGLSLFESGNYRMGFSIEGESEIQFAYISIN